MPRNSVELYKLGISLLNTVKRNKEIDPKVIPNFEELDNFFHKHKLSPPEEDFKKIIEPFTSLSGAKQTLAKEILSRLEEKNFPAKNLPESDQEAIKAAAKGNDDLAYLLTSMMGQMADLGAENVELNQKVNFLEAKLMGAGAEATDAEGTS